MTPRNQTLRVTPAATSSQKYPKQHLNSPSAEELFRELGDHCYIHSASASTIHTPFTTPTPSPIMADRFPSLEDFAPGEFRLLYNLTLSPYTVSEDQLC